MYTLIKPQFLGVFNQTEIDFKLIFPASIMTQNVCLVRLFGQNKVSGLDATAKSLQTTIFCIRFCIKKSRGHIYGEWIVYEIVERILRPIFDTRFIKLVGAVVFYKKLKTHF